MTTNTKKTQEALRMAREAGWPHAWMDAERLERFAALVAAAEREVCAQVVEQGHYAETRAGHAAAIRALAEQPAQQPVSVTDELVDAYCNAWEQSFTEDNPYHKVRMTTEDRKHIVAGLEAALAQAPTGQEQTAQQQEPLLWAATVDFDSFYDSDDFARNFSLTKYEAFQIPLYTSPQPSKPWGKATTWRGLTDEERKEALVSVDAETKRLPPGFRAFAEAIEAKLKEKNGF